MGNWSEDCVLLLQQQASGHVRHLHEEIIKLGGQVIEPLDGNEDLREEELMPQRGWSLLCSMDVRPAH